MKGAGRGEYYLKLAREDYYTKGAEEPGRWAGSGASELGLQGTVDPDAFRNLLDGRSPDGKQALTQNAGRPDRQSGWDLTFSAPKSVSVLWALSSEPIRREIEQAHRKAVEMALARLERQAGVTRRGKGGAIKEPAALLFATFLHTTSRAQDPQIHTHAILSNLGLRRDGTTGSIQSKNIFEAKMEIGACYKAGLATILEQGVRLTIEEDATAFRIVGVPEGICRRFSQRRQEVEEELDRKGRHDAVAAKVAALDTRSKKTEVSRAELFARWRQAAKELGWGPEQAQQLVQSSEHSRAEDPRNEPSIRPEREQENRNGQRQSERADPGRSQDREQDRSTKQDEGFSEREQAAFEERFRRWRDRQGQRQSNWSNQGEKKQEGTQRVQLFPNAPRWSLARRIKIPGALARQDLPRWRSILWRQRWRLGELRIQQRQIFRHTPQWSQLHRIRLPAIRFVPWYRLEPELRPVWGKVRWERRVGPVQVRVQMKRLFPKAPGWSPARKIKLPVIRLMPAVAKPAQQQNRRSHGHSH
jgi:conjugative relaxase-like TrwC/TraI family protein